MTGITVSDLEVTSSLHPHEGAADHDQSEQCRRTDRQRTRRSAEGTTNSYSYLPTSRRGTGLLGVVDPRGPRAKLSRRDIDIKRRASFSKEDRGLLRDWMAIAEKRPVAERQKRHD